MHSYIKTIIDSKQIEIEQLKRKRPSFASMLRQEHLSVIAEIKRRSPSLGPLAEIADPVVLAKSYLNGGAAALSVLTEQSGFGGSIGDLKAVSSAFPEALILRKDFILDLVQIEETARSGAHAVLLIVSILGRDLSYFLQEARKWNLAAVTEVHNAEELEIALKCGAEIIGVNNRCLSSFVVDLSIAEELAPLIPGNIIRIAESGIHTRQDAHRMRLAGYDAVLVGEALVKAPQPMTLLKEMMI